MNKQLFKKKKTYKHYADYKHKEIYTGCPLCIYINIMYISSTSRMQQ